MTSKQPPDIRRQLSRTVRRCPLHVPAEWEALLRDPEKEDYPEVQFGKVCPQGALTLRMRLCVLNTVLQRIGGHGLGPVPGGSLPGIHRRALMNKSATLTSMSTTNATERNSSVGWRKPANCLESNYERAFSARNRSLSLAIASSKLSI